MEIKPSNTPLKIYKLVCPECNESDISLPADSPDNPFCNNCENDVDLSEVEKFVKDWLEYLCDRAALLTKKGENNGRNSSNSSMEEKG